ncbi:MAG TPA: hypothetical protein IAB70_07395 [Candidatus Merdicola faecigallinarum]|uniref:Uncharacterized protein n=1 Tax=Candidatus Merdicola faecigallinarum TaxID=2840862 RepID=A0A9D1M2D9_9FIRM|nr:hypothetical protein [Candidatus Merdicola faecigallinarum]
MAIKFGQEKNRSDIGFFHIETKNFQENIPSVELRIYLNPTRDNEIGLVTELLNKNGNAPFYLKFQSDDYISEMASEKRGRNEKIVIYTDNTHINHSINMIQSIKKEKPFLFQDCEVVNPFMKTIDNVIAIAKEPDTDTYINLNKQKESISQSYNAFLARALDESMARSLSDISKLNAFENFSSLPVQRKIMTLLEKNPDLIIAKMKDYLSQIQELNPTLDIRDLTPSTRETTPRSH